MTYLTEKLRNIKAELGDLPINTIIVAIIAFILLLVALWLGRQAIGLSSVTETLH